MRIDQILKSIRATDTTEKVAQVSPPSSSNSPVIKTAATASLLGALNSALAASPGAGTVEKTASETRSPVTDVMKIAEEMASVEQDAQVKQAQVMGAAFADAFVARLGNWQEKAASLLQTTPAASTGPGSFGKFASDNPGLVNQAQSVGYETTKAALDKQANDEYVRGFNDTVSAIHKTAALEFIKGASIMNRVLDAVLSPTS